ncbi:alpha/beta hydrolase [Paraburkholderia sp. D15]|uniref:alpha/beta hydrolase n=1 Tax=Paraburkholderia sp. D15 TaxID=2880218 RepID=UPI0024793FA7|nr:alpha/beta hydrolase [Paraburkholderia sp. D15]WGS51928.1 alpha/beta hydrolase [Paraburkholderia sp. D15]
MSNTQSDSAGTTDETSSDDAEQEVVRLASKTDKDGHSAAQAPLTPADDTRVKETLHCVRPTIPVIFIPGVMGSPLATKDSGDMAWSAPNTDTITSGLAGLCSLIAGWFRSASSREKLFDPHTVTVTPLGPLIDLDKDSPLTKDEARRRGWGSVYRSSYQPVLLWLEQQLNNPKHLGKLQGAWINGDPTGEKWALHPVLGTDPKTYGAFGEGQAITEGSAEFNKFVKYAYRVYAIGYNWLQSNNDSAGDVMSGLDVVDPKTKKTTRLMGVSEICKENDTGKAIILTHSMGGLVGRFAVLNHGLEDLAHGIFHGCQPATGAPLAAKRFKTGGGPEGGFNGFINGSLLGRDADEFMAVMANAPGPMELTPMPDYHNGAPWWIFARPDGTVLMQFPEEGDAARELYLKDAWYGLLPSEKQLDPAGIVQDRLKDLGKKDTLITNYKNMVVDVVTNQSQLRNRYHSTTYVAYGEGGLDFRPSNSGAASEASGSKPTIEKGELTKELLTWGNAIWTGDVPSDVTEDDLKHAKLLNDSGRGEIRVLVSKHNLSVTFTVQKTNTLPDVNLKTDWDKVASKTGIIRGDGTVPAWSADAQARGLKPGVPGEPAKGVQMAFVQGGYEHMKSNAHPWTHWAMLYSVVQIVNGEDVPVPGN